MMQWKWEQRVNRERWERNRKSFVAVLRIDSQEFESMGA